MTKIVLGLGFGDEGKGLTTSYLCSQTKEPLVVRFNGGHQAGHTVVYDAHRHVFSSFGSGTLQGVETFWSSYCTVYPIAFMNEYRALPKHVKNTVKITMDRRCKVTLPLDLDTNIINEVNNGHGTVGGGFGATIDRCEKHYNLYVQDLMYEHIWKAKVANIAQYLIKNNKLPVCNMNYAMDRMQGFAEAVKDMLEIITIADEQYIDGRNLIFEGAQGIMLDQNFGFFPNVTRSNTTSQNALEMDLWGDKEIFYVTRSYQTRHGAGYMSDERRLPLKNNEKETNKNNGPQGNFRTGNLDISLLKYALTCDLNYSWGAKRNLVITCMDQFECDPERIFSEMNRIAKFDGLYVSSGPSCINVKQIK